ncbi:hypothetical protein C8R46DRAFT_1192535 [Mycena filopes]|nr:hypothetical protein C8R46DRAFT_1192535 [Mycena filopes]
MAFHSSPTVPFLAKNLQLARNSARRQFKHHGRCTGSAGIKSTAHVYEDPCPGEITVVLLSDSESKSNVLVVESKFNRRRVSLGHVVRRIQLGITGISRKQQERNFSFNLSSQRKGNSIKSPSNIHAVKLTEGCPGNAAPFRTYHHHHISPTFSSTPIPTPTPIPPALYIPGSGVSVWTYLALPACKSRATRNAFRILAAGRQTPRLTRKDASDCREHGTEGARAPRSGAKDVSPSAERACRILAAARQNPRLTREDAWGCREHGTEGARAPRSGADVHYTTDRRPLSRVCRILAAGRQTPPLDARGCVPGCLSLDSNVPRARGHRLQDVSLSAEHDFRKFAAGRQTAHSPLARLRARLPQPGFKRAERPRTSFTRCIAVRRAGFQEKNPPGGKPRRCCSRTRSAVFSSSPFVLNSHQPRFRIFLPCGVFQLDPQRAQYPFLTLGCQLGRRRPNIHGKFNPTYLQISLQHPWTRRTRVSHVVMFEFRT